MGARESLQRLLDRKTQEIQELELQIQLARAYQQAIQDSIKALPREATSQIGGEEGIPSEIRPGTLLARARDAIQKHGAPMHISEILAAIGVENTKKSRVSLVGSLGAYVRKGQVFTRPMPNTFGIIGMNEAKVETREKSLPDAFGEVSEGV